MGMKRAEGEIVQVQGGHIIRSTGRKDRHSKVFTAKGPRDRRVRLSANTAIQFYDVQDRLGYDRPSKAVDWLMKKAKSSIGKLAELPPWDPTGNTSAEAEPNVVGSNDMVIAAEASESSRYTFQFQMQMVENRDNDPGFNPSQYSDSVSDPMKSFFPTSSSTSSINFQTYPSDIIPRTSNYTQNLGLSLHSFQDHESLTHSQSQGVSSHTQPNDNTLFTNSGSVGFDASYQTMIQWNNDASTGNRGGGGFLFNSPPLTQQALLGQDSAAAEFAHSQRGTLQSSFSPLFRAWDDLPMPMASSERTTLQQSSMFDPRFASNALPAFFIPTRIQGEEEQVHGVVPQRPSSSSPPNSAHH